MMQMSTDIMSTLRRLKGKAFDIAWMQAMIVHHQMALAMAALVMSRAQHAELKTLAVAINNAQRGEIEQMTTWLKTWYNTVPRALPSETSVKS